MLKFSSVILILAWICVVSLTFFDYYITWTHARSCCDEGNAFTRWLWCDYGKWTLIPQFLFEVFCYTIATFYYKKIPREWLISFFGFLILLGFVMISYSHLWAGNTWLR